LALGSQMEGSMEITDVQSSTQDLP
jgi:hypothetical protein